MQASSQASSRAQCTHTHAHCNRVPLLDLKALAAAAAPLGLARLLVCRRCRRRHVLLLLLHLQQQRPVMRDAQRGRSGTEHRNTLQRARPSARPSAARPLSGGCWVPLAALPAIVHCCLHTRQAPLARFQAANGLPRLRSQACSRSGVLLVSSASPPWAPCPPWVLQARLRAAFSAVSLVLTSRAGGELGVVQAIQEFE